MNLAPQVGIISTSCAARVADVVPGSMLVSVAVDERSQDLMLRTVPEPKSPCTVTVREDDVRHSTDTKGAPLVEIVAFAVADRV